MRKLSVVFLSFFAFFFFLPSSVSAAQCGVDTYNGYSTYPGYVGTGFCNNDLQMPESAGFEPVGQVCCARTTLGCSNRGGLDCRYGRELYCSIDGGGNPWAPAENQSCNSPAHCLLGVENSACPAEPLPSGLQCGIHNDPETNTRTFCAELVGNGAEPAPLMDPSTCGNGGCFRMVADLCGDCQYGRRERCDFNQAGGGGYATVPKTCQYVGNVCILGEFDPTCPAPENPPSNICNASPYVADDGRQLLTQCKPSGTCANNTWIDSYGGCAGATRCCITNQPYTAPPDSFYTDEENGTDISEANFNLCRQAGPNVGICLDCFQGTGQFTERGIWTGVGCVPYNSPTKTIQAFMTLGLGAAGGVVMLMTLAGAFLISTSQGDPKRVDEGKSLITSAVAGVLFIIFSVTILRFIGVNILQLPDFG